MSTRKRKTADKGEDILSSQSKITDAYKKPRTRSDSKKEKEQVEDSPTKEDIPKTKEEKCLEITEPSSSIHELLTKVLVDTTLIRKDIALTNANLEKLLVLAIQEQDGDSLEEM